MKKSLFFLSLILCFAVVNAQNVNVKQSRNGSVKSGQKTIVNPNHVPTTFKVVNNTKDPIPTGYARVTLTAGDIWGDGSGYQLLLDANATAYGVEIPETGPLCDTSAASIAALPAIYSAFEYKIPTNADGILTTSNIVMNNSISIDVLPGTFDYVVTNPTPGDRMWVATNGRGDDYVISAGLEYKFNVIESSTTGDDVTIKIINPNLPAASITWDFQDGYMPAGFKIYSDSNTPATNIANMFPDGWNVITLDSIEYFAAAPSWFTAVAPADRWMVTAKIDLTTGNYLQFDIKSQDADYLETMAVKLSTTTNDKSAFTTELWSSNAVPGTLTNHVFDLSAYNNQSVYIAYVLTSTDMFYGVVDNIKILGQASGLNDISNSNFGVYPNPANDFVTIYDANGADVKVIDMLGRTLITKNISSLNETISIKDLHSGMYMIQMIKDKKLSSQKLIKR